MTFQRLAVVAAITITIVIVICGGVRSLWPAETGAPSSLELPRPMPSQKHASPTFDGENACIVGQLLASQGPDVWDPRLNHLNSQLSRPPFNGYSRFEHISTYRFPCDQTSMIVPLYGGGYFTVRSKQADDAWSTGSTRQDWLCEATREDGRTILKTHVQVERGSSFLIVTRASDSASLVIWLESARGMLAHR